jgi:hypothetical protein
MTRQRVTLMKLIKCSIRFDILLATVIPSNIARTACECPTVESAALLRCDIILTTVIFHSNGTNCLEWQNETKIQRKCHHVTAVLFHQPVALVYIVWSTLWMSSGLRLAGRCSNESARSPETAELQLSHRCNVQQLFHNFCHHFTVNYIMAYCLLPFLT